MMETTKIVGRTNKKLLRRIERYRDFLELRKMQKLSNILNVKVFNIYILIARNFLDEILLI